DRLSARYGMSQLTNGELHAALDTLHAIGEPCAGAADFAQRGVTGLSQLIASELTTLSVCDLDTGHRSVVSDQPGAISRREIEVFDRYFYEHPLVRAHGRNAEAVTKRISDCVPEPEFRDTPLFNEYYRVIGINHVTAVPIPVYRPFLLSFLLH